VIWRSTADRMAYMPLDGESVLAHGHVSVYEPQGQYQFYVDVLFATGRGTLYLQFEALKQRLAEEGLFDAERKRALPAIPGCIGIVTSPEGAALRDIQNVLSRRWPLVHVLVSPTLVQGEEAPGQIVAALQRLYALEDVELIIVARGGGSIEDLWAFNDERVARTIVQSPVPVISGVGHEVDFTIADFAADQRAPTPSAAAELAVPDQTELRGRLSALAVELQEALSHRVTDGQLTLDSQAQRLARLSPAFHIQRQQQAVDDLARRLLQAQRHSVSLRREQAVGLERRLSALDPSAILRRGYAVVWGADGRAIRRVVEAVSGELVSVRVSDGAFRARVE
jgi:exodeoxyribonuclease VII large subunit